MPLCFAYGSNLDQDAMAARCPASRPLGLARLQRHRLALMREGYLTVARDPRRAVHGLLWEVPLADMAALDRYEEVGRGLYVKRHLPVVTAAGPRRALVYVGTNAGPGNPRPGYVESVLEAARRAGLGPLALAELAAFTPAPRKPALASGKPIVEVTAVRPRAATPFDRARDDGSAGWSWRP